MFLFKDTLFTTDGGFINTELQASGAVILARRKLLCHMHFLHKVPHSLTLRNIGWHFNATRGGHFIIIIIIIFMAAPVAYGISQTRG